MIKFKRIMIQVMLFALIGNLILAILSFPTLLGMYHLAMATLLGLSIISLKRNIREDEAQK